MKIFNKYYKICLLKYKSTEKKFGFRYRFRYDTEKNSVLGFRFRFGYYTDTETEYRKKTRYKPMLKMH